MIKSIRLLIESVVPGSSGTLPPLPGTDPIPNGTVRLYHQSTARILEIVCQQGLKFDHAKGIEGPKAIYACETGFYGKPGDIPTLEFYVDKSKWYNPFVLEDVPPSQMIALHLTWHDRARYIIEDKALLKEVLDGEFDDLHEKDKNGDYGIAIDYIKKNFKSQ